jgi:hypothetical protein
MILEVLSEAGPIQVNPIIHNATNPLGSNGRQQRRGQMPAPAFLPLGKHGGSVFSVAGATKHAVISRTHRWTGPPAADRQPLAAAEQDSFFFFFFLAGLSMWKEPRTAVVTREAVTLISERSRWALLLARL